MGGTHEENAVGSQTPLACTCWNLHLLRLHLTNTDGSVGPPCRVVGPAPGPDPTHRLTSASTPGAGAVMSWKGFLDGFVTRHRAPLEATAIPGLAEHARRPGRSGQVVEAQRLAGILASVVG